MSLLCKAYKLELTLYNHKTFNVRITERGGEVERERERQREREREGEREVERETERVQLCCFVTFNIIIS